MIRTSTAHADCPECGECVWLRVTSDPGTRWDPPYTEAEITDQGCDCDLDDYGTTELLEGAVPHEREYEHPENL